METLTLCCLLLLSPQTPAKAHELAPAEVYAPVKEPASLKTATVVFAIGAALDEASTYRFLTAKTLTENGYPTKWIMPVSAEVRGVVQIAVDVAGVYAHRYVGRKWPRLAKASLYIWAAIRVQCAVLNTVRHNRVMAYRAEGRCLEPFACAGK